MQITIAGAGIIGLSLAFELQELGARVTVLADDREPGMATWTAAGMLAPASEADVEHPDLVPLALDSLQRYPDLVRRVEAVAGASCGYLSDGMLWVALHRDHRAELNHLQAFMTARGMRAEALASKALRRLEPALSPRVVGGCRIGADHQVDPRALRTALWQAISRRGGDCLSGVRLSAIRTAADRLRAIQISRDERCQWLDCDHLVLATGAWLGKPLPGLPWQWQLRPIKGQVLRLRGARLLQHVVRTPEVYLVPRADGRLVIGASAEEAGFDTRPLAGPIHELLRHAIHAVPEIQELELEEVSTGLRPATSDHLPLIGATGIEGLWVSGGHYRNGVLLAAASGWHLARQIMQGGPVGELESFDPHRPGVMRND